MVLLGPLYGYGMGDRKQRLKLHWPIFARLTLSRLSPQRMSIGEVIAVLAMMAIIILLLYAAGI